MQQRTSFKGLIIAILAVAVVVSFMGGGGGTGARISSASRDVGHVGCTSLLFASSDAASADVPPFALADVLPYDGRPSVRANGDVPFFTDADRARGQFEQYADLDRLGRCGTAFALVGPETLPARTRESIGMVRPSGWNIARYSWVDGEYLFNRCHLIGYLLTGQNANERNLITGTRSMNVNGMLPFEEQVSAYVHRTGNHVLYRVTPLFEGRNLVASGVLMEAESIEDSGQGVRFCVWCYNVEPGVAIDYATGESHADGTIADAPTATGGFEAETLPDEPARAVKIDPDATYVLNTSSRKFHLPDCPSVQEMGDAHREFFYGTRDEVLELGYVPCGWCKP